MKSSDINGSSEMKLTVTLVLNASFSWWDGSTNGTGVKNYGTLIPLCLLALCSIALNSCIILTICRSYSLKRICLNSHILGLSSCCLLEAGLLMPLSAYFAGFGGKTIGSKVCALDSAILLLMSLLIAWEVSAMCLERWTAVVQRSQRSHSVAKRKVITVMVWTLGILLTFPVALGFTESRYVPKRLSCSVTSEKLFYYVFVVFLAQLILNVFAFTSLLITLLRRYRDKQAAKALAHEISYTERFFEESYFRNEWKNTKFVLTVLMAYAFLQLPYSFSQYYNTLSEKFCRLNNTHNYSTTHYLVDGTESLLMLDKYFIWLRYVFLIVFPIIVLTIRKDVFRKCQLLMYSCKGNNLQHNSDFESHSMSEPLTDKLTDKNLISTSKVRRKSNRTSLTTPMFFDRAKFRLIDVPSRLLKLKARRPQDLDLIPRTPQEEVAPYLSIKHCFVNLVKMPTDSNSKSQMASYEDITEEEIYLSQNVIFDNPPTPTVREVAVQTISIAETNEGKDYCTNQQKSPAKNCTTNGSVLSFTKSSKPSSASKTSRKCRYESYPSTFVKLRKTENSQSSHRTDCGLSSVLKMRKTGSTPCVVLPRSTAELLDAVGENGDAVSL